MTSCQPKRLWEIVGGVDKGGILVRQGRDLTSAQLPDRLSTGAHVEEVELISGRLRFIKVLGTGPQEGWISIVVGGKTLAKPFVLEAMAPAPTNASEMPAAHNRMNLAQNLSRAQDNSSTPRRPPLRSKIDGSKSRSQDPQTATESWDKNFGSLLRDRPITNDWTYDAKRVEYASVFAPGNSEVLLERAEHFCLDNGVSSCVALPSDALEWDDRECELWFRTDGRFHPRDTVGLFRQSKLASEHHLPRSVAGRVSVICPTTEWRQQHHELLWLCFDSQDWPDKELVVVETYITAPSPFFTALAQDDSRIVYVGMQQEKEIDLSVGVKRNVAIHMSTGQFIAHFDDDDLYASTYLSVMVGDLRNEKKACAAKLSNWYLANLKSKFSKGNILVDPSFALCDPLRLHDREEGSARDNPVVKSRLYGFGFSYVYYRSVALDTPFADMNIGEDYHFYSTLLDSKGGRSIDLIDDERGICLHMQHSSNLTDGSLCKYLDVQLEDLFKLDVAKSSGFNIYMNLAGYGDQPLSPELVATSAALLGLDFRTVEYDGEMCMLAPDGVVYDLKTREPLGILNKETQQVDPYTEAAVKKMESKKQVLIMPEINASELDDAVSDDSAEFIQRGRAEVVSKEKSPTAAKVDTAFYDLDWADDLGGGADTQHGSVDVWDLD